MQTEVIGIIREIRNGIYKKSPLIHCITNPISINQCANGVLAVGARPMMAEHPEEVGEITPTANGLLLNLGNITDARMKSMLISAECARFGNIPYAIDAVGVACSKHRREYAKKLMDIAPPTVLKGNYSEITALGKNGYSSAGVDADKALTPHDVSQTVSALAKGLNTIVLASGKIDIVSDGKYLVYVKNGTPMLSKITGTGCMLGALCACCLSERRDIWGAVTACAVLGICGQLADKTKGKGSFFVSLMDRLSTLSNEDVEKNIDMEICEL